MEVDGKGWLGVGLILTPIVFCSWTNEPSRVHREWEATSPPGSVPGYVNTGYPTSKSHIVFDSGASPNTPRISSEAPKASNIVLPPNEEFGADMRFIGVSGAGRVEVEMLEDGAYVFKADRPATENLKNDPVLNNNYGIIRQGDNYINMSNEFTRTMEQLRKNHL